MRTFSLLLAILLGMLLGSCRPVQPAQTGGSCALPIASDANDEERIRAVLQAEGELVVAQQIDSLMALWGEGSRVVDAKNTPSLQADDQEWIDKDAVRHRYVRTVFPGAPAAAAPANLIVTIDGDQATVTSTTQIGDEISPAGDLWLLHKQDGCWLINRLTFNLEPTP